MCQNAALSCNGLKGFPPLQVYYFVFRALYGVIKAPSDFATLLLAVYIANLLLYLIFYMLVKVKFVFIYLNLSICHLVVQPTCYPVMKGQLTLF